MAGFQDVYPESTTEHLPDLLHQVITAATGCIEAASDSELTAVLSMCSKLLSNVQPSMATPTGDDLFDTDSLYRMPDAASPQGQDLGSAVVQGDKGAEGDDGSGDGSTETENVVMKNGADEENAVEKTIPVIPETVKKDNTAEGADCKAESGVNGPEEQSEQQTKPTNDSSEGTKSATDSSNKDNIDQEGSKTDSEGPQKPISEPKKAIPQDGAKPPGEKHHPMKLAPKDGQSTKLTLQQKSREDRPREHLGLMQQCLGSFQEFFHCIVTHRFLESEAVCEKCMELLSLGPAEGCRTSDQDSLFDESSLCSADTDAIRAKLSESGSHPKVKPRLCTEEGQAAFVRACRLLVDFASFPLYCADYQTLIDQMYNTGECV